jgi:hypothetical protein
VVNPVVEMDGDEMTRVHNYIKLGYLGMDKRVFDYTIFGYSN